jgi:hypothetical protein
MSGKNIINLLIEKYSESKIFKGMVREDAWEVSDIEEEYQEAFALLTKGNMH